MALLQCGGYKDRDPVLSIFFLDVESTRGLRKSVRINPGLLDVAYDMASDAERNLVYIADEYRVKSYQYGTGRKPLPKHTLQST